MRSRRSCAAIVAAALLVGGLVGGLAVASPAGAATGLVVRETGRAYYPSDGDTFWICLKGHTCTPSDVRSGNADVKAVRLMSIQAMEVPHPDGLPSEAAAAGVAEVTTPECHALDAEHALDRLLFGTSTVTRAKLGREVRLLSQKASSSSYGRIRRVVQVKVDGAWVDAQSTLLTQGLALWMPLPTSLGEWSQNATYRAASQKAAAKGLGLFDADACATGPAQSAKLALDVHWDAEGDDTTNVDGEWVRIRNTGSVAVDLAGWTLRTAGWDMEHFGSRTVLRPGGSVIVHSGKKPAHVAAGNYYVGSAKPFYQNVDPAHGVGGGSYLVDADGDYRAWSIYPSSAKPSGVRLTISKVVDDPAGNDTAHRNGEYVRITNTGHAATSLAPFLLTYGAHSFVFPTNARVAAGGSVKVRVGSGSRTATTFYWGRPTALLANSGGAVRLTTYAGATMACKAWGSRSC